LCVWVSWCAHTHFTIKACVLTGAFNLSPSIISPHTGEYQISIISFLPSCSDSSIPISLAELIPFVKGRNATLAEEEMWILIDDFKTSTPTEGNVPANGFE